MSNIISKGYLDVPGGHKLYFEEWGNPAAPAIFFLHGGPGAGFRTKHRRLFDPNIHHIVFYDQRGAGRSLPYASTTNNTTQDLIWDINILADHLKIKKFSLAGGSWGSALSLLYAIAHPERVQKLFLWSIYLVRKEDEENLLGQSKKWFPEAWKRFISNVPESDRTTGEKIMNFYAKKIGSQDIEDARIFAAEWSLWNLTMMSIQYDREMLETMISAIDPIPHARLELHYFLHNMFIPENYILDNIQKIRHIPLHIVQGRFDMCTPPLGAYDLVTGYGKNASIVWTLAGHRASDPQNRKAIKKMFRSVQ